MQATDAKDMREEEFLALALRLSRHVWNVPRPCLLLSPFLAIVLLLACSLGCAPSSSQDDGKQGPSASSDRPELTDEMIRERINDARVREVPEENGAAEPIGWSFIHTEPKDITVVDKQVEGDRATIVLDIKTTSSPRSREQRFLAGQIRTEWELKTGWVLRQWEIVKTENISMKYRNLPKPPAQNSNL